ncbi:MAG: hypothetical protein K9K38_18730 [Rhodoferax sp.]|nr:hypothetical protein [Rhodoferax sp.]
MDILYDALREALPIWERAVGNTGWFHGVVVVAYLSAAWFCLVNAHIARQSDEPAAVWYLAVTVLCLLACNTLLQVDLLSTLVLRGIAKIQGWYGARRELQYTVVALVAVLGIGLARRLRHQFINSDTASEPVALGLTVLLALFAVRAISAHGTDAMLNVRLAGMSVGRLIELTGIALVLHGARRCLQHR